MWGALAGMLVGAATVLVWIYLPLEIAGNTLAGHMYEMVPGVLLSTLAIVVVSRLTAPPSQAVIAQFEEMTQELDDQLKHIK